MYLTAPELRTYGTYLRTYGTYVSHDRRPALLGHERARSRPPPRSARRWLATLGATAVSTYALDAVATAAGAALAASGCSTARRTSPCSASSPLTYVAWGAGLRRNLGANWALLEQTGTSTNALSKAAHDLAALRGWRPRTRRLAGSAGYVATELAKEAPYYAGAFGAALVSDSVSSGDAIVFLGGANLGAAAYEYGLAGLTRAFLRRGHASFDADWVPDEYLADYYAVVEPDEVETIAFFTDAIRETAPDEPILFFGTGPTLHHVFLSAGRASEIHLADYLPQNLAEIERWLRARRRRPRLAAVRALHARVRGRARADRGAARRARGAHAREGDAAAGGRRRRPRAGRRPLHAPWSARTAPTPPPPTARPGRPTCATSRGSCAPGGVFITAALRRSRSYLVGGKRFPSADVDEHDLRAVLEPEFDCAIEVREVPDHARLGYAGIVLATARRRPPASAPARA